jgi:hypothetical protein
MSAQERADAAVQLRRALWACNAKSRARRQFSHALTLLVDVDEQAADQVRQLLSTPGQRLPKPVMKAVDHGENHVNQ